MSTVNAGWRGPNIVRDGLVLYLDAASGTSYTNYVNSGTWKDISGNGFDATMSGSVIYSGSAPQSFQYVNGANNYFVGNNNLVSTIITGVTITSWVKVYNTSVRSFVFSKYVNAQPAGYLLEAGTVGGLWTNSLRFYAQGTGFISTDYRGVTNAITQNSIQMVTATYDYASKTTAMYVNGLVISATETGLTPSSMASNWYNTSIPYKVGGNRPQETLDAAMNQYNLMVYNRALSTTEVLKNYNSTKTRFGL